jgi:restriction system protein
MSIPDYQTIMLPLLQYTKDEQEHSLRESIEYLGSLLKLSEADKKLLLPSGQQATFDNRVGWASFYLKKAQLLEKTRRGYFKITERGKQVLIQNPSEISNNFLNNFPEFIDFKINSKNKDTQGDIKNYLSETLKTPEESLELYYVKIMLKLEKPWPKNY